MSNAPSQPQMGGYGRGMNSRMGMGLGGFGSFGGFGGGSGMPFNLGGFGGFNPMMGYGGFGGFNPMMGYGGMGGFGGFNPMMGMGLGSFGGFGNQFDPRAQVQQYLQQTPSDPFANQGVGVPKTYSVGVGNTYREYPSPSNQQTQPPQMAQRYDASMANPQADYFRQQQQMMYDREANMTDYQRLMDRQRMGNMPRLPTMSGGLGLNPLPINAPSDLEIATSLGYKDPNAWRDMVGVPRLPSDPTAKQENEARQTKAKEYLNSIGYGQSGFDPSKYEVRKQPSAPVSMFGLLRGFGG
jgi:hypothetical protein